MEKNLSILLGLGVVGALVALGGRSWNALRTVLGRLEALLGRQSEAKSRQSDAKSRQSEAKSRQSGAKRHTA